MNTWPKSFFALCVRSFIFGAEDSLVSTVGLLSGIAAAGVPKGTVFLAGMILIFVEAFSMAAGSFLSERSAEEYVSHAGLPMRYFIFGGVIMFFSYFFSGFVPLSPYLFFEVTTALPLSITITLLALFVLGAISARVFKTNIFRSGIRMLAFGGVATGLGVLVGFFLK